MILLGVGALMGVLPIKKIRNPKNQKILKYQLTWARID